MATLTAGRIVAVQDVTRRFQHAAETVTALDAVSVRLLPGQLTVAAGPSGSGKTTLLSIIAGIDRPDAGRVTLDPPAPAQPDRLPWRLLAFVPQALALLDELTVRENIDLPALLEDRDAGSPDETHRLLDLLQIAHLGDRYPTTTSGGEQQRVAIARALRLRPAVLLADEPTGHQDRGRVGLVLDILRQHAYAGHVVLVSSHDEAVIRAADRLLRLVDGRLVYDSGRP